MKKRSLIVVLAVLCLATSCFVGSTFAKYTSSATGSDTVTVATWTWTGDVDISNNSLTFALDETVTNTKEGVNDSVGAESVVSGKMAPGTSGSFTITLNNTSEVAAEYLLQFTLPTAPSSLTFTYQNGSAAAETLTSSTQITGELAHTNGSVDIVVNWVWDYDAIDDTQYAGTDITVSANCTLEQVD